MKSRGFISTTLSLLKRNTLGRREKHAINEPKLRSESIVYDFPEVSEEERKIIVEKIMRRRRTGDLLIYIFIILVFLLLPIFYFITSWI